MLLGRGGEGDRPSITFSSCIPLLRRFLVIMFLPVLALRLRKSCRPHQSVHNYSSQGFLWRALLLGQITLYHLQGSIHKLVLCGISSNHQFERVDTRRLHQRPLSHLTVEGRSKLHILVVDSPLPLISQSSICLAYLHTRPSLSLTATVGYDQPP